MRTVKEGISNLFNHVEKGCNSARSLIKVNGKEIEPVESGPGHNVVALDMKGAAIMRHHYNTQRNPAVLKYLINDLRTLPDDSIIIIATQVIHLIIS